MTSLREKAPSPKPPPEIRADERRYADWQEGCGAGIRFMSQLNEALAEKEQRQTRRSLTMPKFNQYEASAKAWATSHVVAALLATAVLFFVLGATLT